MNGSRRIASLVFLGALCVSASASAQRAAPDARGYGLATAYSARARGHESPFWNPANLGLSRNPDWSVGLNASAYFSNNALGYGQITDLYGEYLDAAEKSRLLADVQAATGGDPVYLAFDVGAQGLGASFGRFAAGIGGIGAGNAVLPPDALAISTIPPPISGRSTGALSRTRSHSASRHCRMPASPWAAPSGPAWPGI